MGTATMTASSARLREGKTEERGGGRSRERGRSERGSGTSPWRREEVGEAATAKQEVAGVGARASSTQLLRALAREEDRRRGPGGLGRWGSWAGQVSR